jgi:hypothetical protein
MCEGKTMGRLQTRNFRFAVAILSFGTAAFGGDDPVVAKAKEGTRIAVRKTKEGTSATVRAVRTAAEWTTGDPSKKPSAETISKARKKGLVWADHQDWVYYKDGPNFGRTERGEFWTEDGAKGAGYKQASAKASETPQPQRTISAEAVTTKPAPAK